MESRFLVLLRFVLRVDNVFVRMIETRYVHVFGEDLREESADASGRGTEMRILREVCAKESKWSAIVEEMRGASAEQIRLSTKDLNVLSERLPMHSVMNEEIVWRARDD